MLKSSLVENEDQKNKKTMKNYKMFRLIRLPDIVSMDVKVGKPHWYWKLLGIKAKEIPTSLEFKKGKNGASNRYLKMMTIRLLILLGNEINLKELDVAGKYGNIWVKPYNLLRNKNNKKTEN